MYARLRETLRSALDNWDTADQKVPLAVAKAVIKFLNHDVNDRVRPPHISYQISRDGSLSGQLRVTFSHGFHSAELLFRQDPGGKHPRVLCDYIIDHDHWVRASGVHVVEEFEIVPYVVDLEINSSYYLWTPEQEVAEEAEAKQRQAEFDAMVERDTVEMTAVQRMGWILRYPLRRELLYESKNRNLLTVEEM